MSRTANFKTTNGKEYELALPAPGKGDSYFIFSLPKAGSTLLMQVMIDVNKELGIPMIDLPTRLFSLGIKPTDLREDINQLWQEKGYSYLGFRSYLPTMRFDFTKTRNILLVRDPRDMLVSLYFSVRFSHQIPKLKGEEHPLEIARKRTQEMGIDQYVLNSAPAILKNYLSYMKHLPHETTRVYRYEDIIFRKKEWITDMLDFLGLKLPASKINRIAQAHDKLPDAENPKKHVRQVTPGNYTAHLSRATIEKLDEVFRRVMVNFQYESVISFSMGTEAEGRSTQNAHEAYNLKDEKIRLLERDLEGLRQSWSWRSTKLLRMLGAVFRRQG